MSGVILSGDTVKQYQNILLTLSGENHCRFVFKKQLLTYKWTFLTFYQSSTLCEGKPIPLKLFSNFAFLDTLETQIVSDRQH